MPAHIKAHITKQFEKAFKHTSKAKHVLENKETKPYAQCVSLNKSLKKKSENQWLQRFKYNHQLQQSCRKDTYCNFRYLCCVSLLLEIYSKSRRGRILIGKLQERHLKPQHFQWLNEFRVTCHSWVWVLSVWPIFPLLHCIIFCSTCFQIHDQGNFLPQLWLSGHGAVITNPPVIQKNCQAGKMQQHQY